MAMEGTIPEFCWNVIKVTLYLQKNFIVTYNFWQELRLIVVDPNRPRNFRLDARNIEQLSVINDA